MAFGPMPRKPSTVMARRKAILGGVADGSAGPSLPPGLLVQQLGQFVLAFKGGEDQGRPVVLRLGLGLQPLQDEVAQGGVRHERHLNSDLPCPRPAVPSAH